MSDVTTTPPPALDTDSPLALEVHARCVPRLAERRDEPQQPRVEARLAYHNVRIAQANLLAERPRLEGQLPSTWSWQPVDESADVALACVVAAARVARAARTPSDVPGLYRRASDLRTLLLDALTAAARAGVLPLQEVLPIKKGRGTGDTASDCIASVALFRKYDQALAGKTAVTAEHLVQAEQVGTDLLKAAKPEAGQGVRDAALDGLVLERNRLWGWLLANHRELRRLGYWIWVEACDEHVPELGAQG